MIEFMPAARMSLRRIAVVVTGVVKLNWWIAAVEPMVPASVQVLPERYSTLGSTVVQVMLLKPLR